MVHGWYFWRSKSENQRFSEKSRSNIDFSVTFRTQSIFSITAKKVSKHGVCSGPYFPAFGLNTSYLSIFSPNARKYGPEKTLYLVTFHAVYICRTLHFRCLTRFWIRLRNLLLRNFLQMYSTIKSKVGFPLNLESDWFFKEKRGFPLRISLVNAKKSTQKWGPFSSTSTDVFL